MGQTQKSILGSPRYHFLLNSCPLAVESGNQQEMTAEMSNFPSMRHHTDRLFVGNHLQLVAKTV
jgi:hypothetical protein